MSNPSPIIKLTANDLKNAPNVVEASHYWITLLGYDTVIFKDARDGSIIILVPFDNFPDIFFEFDVFGRELIFYTNILTELDPDESPERYSAFLIDVLNEQTKYPQIRLSVNKQESIILKLYLRFRASNLTMEFLTQLIREAENFLKDVTGLIEGYKFPEAWRVTESDKKIPERSHNRHDYF